MSDVSIGAGASKKTSMQEGVDAQAETDRDIDRGLAGAEAKPFANRPPAKDADSITSASRENPPAADGAGGLISGRRNAGRE